MNELLKYTDLLHKYQDPGSKQVIEFVEKHSDNEALMTRVDLLNSLFLLNTPETVGSEFRAPRAT